MENILTLADRYKELRDTKQALNNSLKDVNAEIDTVEKTLIEQMVNEEVQRFDRNGQLFYLSSKMYASPRAGVKEELYGWLKENGYADMVKETVHAQTLNSFVKEQLDEHNITADELKELLKDEQRQGEELEGALGQEDPGLAGLLQLAELLNIFDKPGVNMRKA